MKHLLLGSFLAVALLVSACEKQSGINAPVSQKSTATSVKYVDQLNLTNEQAAQLVDVFYMGTDLSVILNPQQVVTVNGMVSGGNTVLVDNPRAPRFFFDMEAVMWYRLILKANTDVTDDQKKQVQDAINASNAKRQSIITDATLTDQEKKDALKAEHDALMATLSTIFTPDQLANAQALKDKLDQQRKDQQAQWTALRIQRQVDMLTKLLTLDDNQKTQITDILTKQNAQIQVLRDQYKGDPEGFRAAMLQLQKDTDAQIYALLTLDQQAIWDKMHNGGGGRGDGGGGKGGSGGTVDPGGVQMQVDMWTKVLNLTADQATQIKDLLTKQNDQIVVLRDQYKDDPAGFRTAMEQLEKDTNSAIYGLLTPDQQAIWDKLHNPMGGGRDGGGKGGGPIGPGGIHP